jgi:hypothetical protein
MLQVRDDLRHHLQDTPRAGDTAGRKHAGTQFICFTCTKVQMLTPEELQDDSSITREALRIVGDAEIETAWFKFLNKSQA